MIGELLNIGRFRRRARKAQTELRAWADEERRVADVRGNLGRPGQLPEAFARGRADAFDIAADLMNEVRSG